MATTELAKLRPCKHCGHGRKFHKRDTYYVEGKYRAQLRPWLGARCEWCNCPGYEPKEQD